MSRMLPSSEGTERIVFSLYPSEVQEIRELAGRWGSVGRAVQVAVEVLFDRFQRDQTDSMPLGLLGLGVPDEVVMAGKAVPQLKVPYSCYVTDRTKRLIEWLADPTRHKSRNAVLRTAMLWLNAALTGEKRRKQQSKSKR